MLHSEFGWLPASGSLLDMFENAITGCHKHLKYRSTSTTQIDSCFIAVILVRPSPAIWEKKRVVMVCPQFWGKKYRQHSWTVPCAKWEIPDNGWLRGSHESLIGNALHYIHLSYTPIKCRVTILLVIIHQPIYTLELYHHSSLIPKNRTHEPDPQTLFPAPSIWDSECQLLVYLRPHHRPVANWGCRLRPTSRPAPPEFVFDEKNDGIPTYSRYYLHICLHVGSLFG
jgi:hypothetical protein